MLHPCLPDRIIRRAAKMDMPVLYVEAVKALDKCVTMNEAKYYADKSDALAAWAKIYGSDDDKKAAARLKLHAYKRMGELAGEIAPRVGRGDGPVALLKKHGLSRNGAAAARGLSKLPEAKFKAVLEKQKSPILSWQSVEKDAASWPGRIRNSDAWQKFSAAGFGPMSFRTWTRGNDAKALAQGMSPDEAKKACAMMNEIVEWFDEFDRCLRKP